MESNSQLDRRKVLVRDIFFLLFFISARSLIECLSNAHLEARLALNRFISTFI
jgi:hypothetical protein